MAVVFAEVGQDVHLVGGSFEDAIHEGVRLGYTEGLLRCSVAADPIRRGNTGDNTPAIVHTRLVPGDRVTLTVAPKGFGSENMSRLRMMTPAATEEDIIAFVAETVREAGGNPCLGDSADEVRGPGGKKYGSGYSHLLYGLSHLEDVVLLPTDKRGAGGGRLSEDQGALVSHHGCVR